jgi:hypothetical protein
MRTYRRARKLVVQTLEAREVPANLPLVAFGADAGADPTVRVLDGDTGAQKFQFTAFRESFQGGVRVAVGDVTGDGQDDIIAATGAGMAAVKIFDGITGDPVRSFYAGPPVGGGSDGLLSSQQGAGGRRYAGGLTVAVGDLNGDGKNEIVTACDKGQGIVSVFSSQGKWLRGFKPAYRGRVAVGDTDGDGKAEIILGSASSSEVRVHDGRTFARELRIEAVIDEPDGVNVAAADIDGDGIAEVVVGSGSSADVAVFDSRTGDEVLTLTAEVEGAGGVRVAGGVISEDGMADLLVGSATTGEWAAYDGIGDPLDSDTLTGFDDGVWVARSARQDDVNRHATQVIRDWNAAALDAIRTTSMNPPRASRALAILQTAVYDAVNGIVKGGRKYLVTPDAPVGASPQAAAAQAAHDTLVALFPAQETDFDDLLTTSLDAIPDGTAEDDGVEWGATVAAAVLEARADDGSVEAATAPYTPGTDPGDWQPTPPTNAAALLPGWGDVTPFGIGRVANFVPNGPPKLSGAKWAAEFNEVKDLGSATSTTRTADQTAIAQFWADGAGTFTPPGHWNAIAADLVEDDAVGLFKTAKVFAQLDVALADAAIVCWETKFKYNFWRPVTAIRAADTDGNPATEQDATWTPLLGTPPFPDYTSGHSTFSGAASIVLAAAFGATREFSATSDNGATTRTFDSFRAAADEAGMSRIYGGIHYTSANQEGLRCGRQIAASVLQRVG